VITLNVEKQGESITFPTAPDSAAPRLDLEVTLAPGASGPPPHMHTRQSESFHVVSGAMIVKVDGKEHRLKTGESLMVMQGQAHSFANASASDPLHFRVALEPAFHFQWFLTEMARSAIRGGGSWDDLPLLEAAYILHQVRDQYRVAGIPFLAQDIVFGFLARVAVVTGRTKQIAPKLEAAAASARPGLA
jgi:hypothetical protein